MVWTIGKERNEHIFSGKDVDPIRYFREIKDRVWLWLIEKKKLNRDILEKLKLGNKLFTERNRDYKLDYEGLRKL